MKIRKQLFILLAGILIGIALSPFTSKPQNLLSPTPLTFGQMINQSELPITQHQVLGDKNEVKTSKLALLIADQQPKTYPSPLPKKIEPIVSSYPGFIRVAILGDSMVDVMENGLPYLQTELKKYYPKAKLSLFNFGVGAQNIEEAYKHLNEEYHYHDRNYPSLITLNPEIIVLGTFSYNPFSKNEDELFLHWSYLNKITETIKTNTKAKIIILAEIAPAKTTFGQGPKGVNWGKDFAWQHGVKIQQYLENAINFAKTNNFPLANAYEVSLLANHDGNPLFINSDDHIHQNTAGNKLMAKLIAEQIIKLNLY